MDAFALLCRTEGIIPAIESAHAVAGALEVARELGPEATIVVCLSGRGDKDIHTAAEWFHLVDASGEVTDEATEEPVHGDAGLGGDETAVAGASGKASGDAG